MNVAICTRTAVPNPAARRWQRARCVQLAEQLGLEVTHEYHDDGKSRPTLDPLLPEILAGGVSTPIVASIDRLGRSIADNDRTSRSLSEAEVEVYAAYVGPVPISPPMMQLIGVIAAAERKTVSRLRRNTRSDARPPLAHRPLGQGPVLLEEELPLVGCTSRRRTGNGGGSRFTRGQSTVAWSPVVEPRHGCL